jgi:hypothetical protein
MRALALPALVILVGCSHQVGVKIDLEVVKTFRAGVTTRAEVEAKLGKPTTVVVMGQRTTCSWSWAKGTTFSGGESQMVMLSFGADQVLLQDSTVSSTKIR